MRPHLVMSQTFIYKMTNWGTNLIFVRRVCCFHRNGYTFSYLAIMTNIISTTARTKKINDLQ